MKWAIIIICALASGSLSGVSVGMAINAKTNVLFAIPWAFLFIAGLVCSAWFFSPDGPFYVRP